MARWLWMLLVSPPLVWPQSFSLPSKEVLSYNIEWRLITAGKAQMEWTATPAPHAGYQINAHVESVGFVSKLFKVDDDYRANLNPAVCIENSQLIAHEGIRRRETRVNYDPETRKATYLERDTARNSVVESKEIDIPECVHDLIGGIYFLRTLNLEPGQSTEVPVSDGKKSVLAKVEAQQREDIKTPEGSFKTIRYEIYLFNNVLYRRAAHLNVWISDDRRRLPVQLRVRMQFTIGTITLQLVPGDPASR